LGRLERHFMDKFSKPFGLSMRKRFVTLTTGLSKRIAKISIEKIKKAIDSTDFMEKVICSRK
jgi:hypothetical protein